jgi:hypothetical protein
MYILGQFKQLKIYISVAGLFGAISYHVTYSHLPRDNFVLIASLIVSTTDAPEILSYLQKLLMKWMWLLYTLQNKSL